MKKLLIGAFIVATSLTYAKEMTVTPIVVEEAVVEGKNEITEIAVVETPTTDYLVMETEEILNNNVYLRAGVNIWSEYDSYSISGNNLESEKITKGKKDNLGFEFALEGTRNITDNLELGLGIAYQQNAKLKTHSNSLKEKYEMGNYNSVPLYVTGKYNITTFSNGITPYVKANLGYSFNLNEKNVKFTDETGATSTGNLKVDNGLYYGAGVGMEYNNFLMDIMYQQTTADAKVSFQGEKTNKKSFDHSRVTLSLGYKFNF